MKKSNDLQSNLKQVEQLLHEGRYDESIALCETLLPESAILPQTLSLLGFAHMQKGENHIAIDIFKRSLALNPKQVNVLSNLGLALDYAGHYSQAIACYNQALQYSPNFETALINLSGSLIELGDLTGAMKVIKDALEENSSCIGLLNNLIVIYLETQQFNQASMTIKKALSIDKNNADLFVNAARLQSLHGNHLEAINYLRHADSLRPEDPNTLYSLSLSLLMLQQFKEGWELYKWRGYRTKVTTYVSPWSPKLRLPYANTSGKQHPSQLKLLLVHEQGIGDELFFLRFASLAAKIGYKIFYYPSAKLYPLMINQHHIQSDITFINPALSIDYKQFNLIFPVGDLPQLLQDRSVAIPPPFTIRADIQLVENMFNKGKSMPRPWIGVTCKAGIKTKMGEYEKSIDIDKLIKHIPTGEGTIFIFQPNCPDSMIQQLSDATGYKVFSTSWCMDSMPNLTALLYVLDGYIGVSNTNMHILAGLNKSGTMIETIQTDFRWSLDSQGQPIWFPDFTVIPYEHSPKSYYLTDFSKQVKRQ